MLQGLKEVQVAFELTCVIHAKLVFEVADGRVTLLDTSNWRQRRGNAPRRTRGRRQTVSRLKTGPNGFAEAGYHRAEGDRTVKWHSLVSAADALSNVHQSVGKVPSKQLAAGLANERQSRLSDVEPVTRTRPLQHKTSGIPFFMSAPTARRASTATHLDIFQGSAGRPGMN